jgi:hypothetical protein
LICKNSDEGGKCCRWQYYPTRVLGQKSI